VINGTVPAEATGLVMMPVGWPLPLPVVPALPALMRNRAQCGGFGLRSARRRWNITPGATVTSAVGCSNATMVLRCGTRSTAGLSASCVQRGRRLRAGRAPDRVRWAGSSADAPVSARRCWLNGGARSPSSGFGRRTGRSQHRGLRPRFGWRDV